MAKIKQQLEDFIPDPRLVDERGATPQRVRKSEGYADYGDTGTQTMRDSPIERAILKRQITDDQYKAATKFYMHWYRAGMAGSLGSTDLNRVFGGEFGFTGAPRSEVELFHRDRYRQAVRALGFKWATLLEKIVCRDVTFEEVGRSMGWLNRPQAFAAAIQITRDCLDRLCSEWGIG